MTLNFPEKSATFILTNKFFCQVGRFFQVELVDFQVRFNRYSGRTCLAVPLDDIREILCWANTFSCQANRLLGRTSKY